MTRLRARVVRTVRSPVIQRYAAALLVGVAARWGFDLDVGATTAVLAVLFGVGSMESMRKVTPVADPRLPKGVKAGRYER